VAASSVSQCLTVPWGNTLTIGESSRADILTVAPPSPVTLHLFLEAEAAVAVKGNKADKDGEIENRGQV